MKATRKPSKGGLPNVMFVQAAVEDLPDELAGVANEIYINFPWGSLLRAVATADGNVLNSIRRIAAPGCLLRITIGVDPERDQTELNRLNIPEITFDYLESVLLLQYRTAGFSIIEHRELNANEWSRLETSWARRLQPNAGRQVVYFVLRVS